MPIAVNPADPAPVSPQRAWYAASIAGFLQAPPDQIVGQLTENSDFTIELAQRDAWLIEIQLLRTALAGLTGGVLLEFNIPRVGQRIDAVVLSGPVVFAIEFKVGASMFDRAAFEQVWDYALDLKNFHETSASAAIVPILVATEAETLPQSTLHRDDDNVYRPLRVSRDGIRSVIDMAIRDITGDGVDPDGWPRGRYRPTPTIIEAARALYANHSVEAIAKLEAGKDDLRVTTDRIDEIVDEALTKQQKVICFVTGVPGAGETLVGLNVATRHRREQDATHAVYLSGNGPLIAVLHAALTRDEVVRRRKAGERVRKGRVEESVKAFIQNVHHFRDDALVDKGPPIEHVVIFDEAQRAWNLTKTANFMQKRKKQPGFSQSEPEFLISCMDRQPDWAVVICLVGGGQEIHTGEAGIDAWLDAIESRFPNWRMFISSRLTDSEYAAGKVLDRVRRSANVRFDDSLHLAVSMRSFRAENVSAFVKALLECNKDAARTHLAQFAARYPIVLTRALAAAKDWVRKQARGSQRYGLVASSKAQRLKPHAIDIRVDVDPVHWFLSDRDDTRSSYYLEDAATEFQVQGLELDWTCVTWDGDLRFNGSDWTYHDFRGKRWQDVKKPENKNYLRNAYRVLLTRARQGMAIFVPTGDASDATRSPAFYNTTFEYLADIGVPVLT